MTSSPSRFRLSFLAVYKGYLWIKTLLLELHESFMKGLVILLSLGNRSWITSRYYRVVGSFEPYKSRQNLYSLESTSCKVLTRVLVCWSFTTSFINMVSNLSNLSNLLFSFKKKIGSQIEKSSSTVRPTFLLIMSNFYLLLIWVLRYDIIPDTHVINLLSNYLHDY